MKKALVFEAPRTGYGIEQIKAPMTVGLLKEFLEGCPDDTLFILSHDRGHTFGTIDEYDFQIAIQREDGEWEFAE